ncbi:lysozyme (plasmid) [Serratia sp. AXJ-M]|uniref:lysozyme n=1 Tax=Serratia sp. AXJ-M TaxID=2754727 RepID=UPI00397A062E
MILSERGLSLIKHFEGKRLQAYLCAAGVWTIGYGHTDDVRPGDVIDDMKADSFLRRDVTVSENIVRRFVRAPLNQDQFDALVSFVFNIGIRNFESSTMLKKLNAGDSVGASDEFLRWVYAAGKSISGLVFRRQAEKRLFLSLG